MTEQLKMTGRNLAIAKRLLKDVTKVLEKSNVPYRLDAGTLLGIIRENRLLPWDKDMDICTNETRYAKLQLLAWKFRFRGYWAWVRRIKRDLPPLKRGAVRVLRVRNRKFGIIAGPIKLDIFIWHHFGDKYYWIQGYTGREVTLAAPKEYFEPAIRTNFDGKEYWIPEAFEEYLTQRYGEWRIPRQEWNPLTEDGSIISIPETPAGKKAAS
jgi:hypothetical protein